MRYSYDIIEKVRMRNDIVDVISSYVQLKRKGNSYFGLCPFHNEKSPSFSVSHGKQMYYCFGCGSGGNVYTFLMEYENCSFQEAVKVLSGKAGIKLPEIEYSQETKELNERKTLLLEINKQAAKYFYCKLRTPGGTAAMAYLKRRGLSDETIRIFGLGYSDKYNNDLYKFLKKKGYSDELLKDSGLFNVDEKRGMYDKFWKRVIYPIMDVNNRVIGFGGRVMGDIKPKYLNSPETKIFDKSKNLYGLNSARTSRRRNLIICEGYMDVISMYQAGFTNAVASMGTALTSQQVRLLKRYTDEVLLIYDSDEAGVKAVLRAIPMLKSVGLATKVVNLRPYNDPDELIQKEGTDALKERLERAENSFLFEVRILKKNYDIMDPQGRTNFFHEVAKKLLKFEDEIERNSYLETVSRLYHIQADMLKNLVHKLALKKIELLVQPKPRIFAKQIQKQGNDIDKAQKLMMTWVTNYPEILRELKNYLKPEDFTTPLYRQVAKMVEEQFLAGEVSPARIINHFEDSEQQRAVAALFHTQIFLKTEKERKKALQDVLYNMKDSSIAYRLSRLDPTDLMGLQHLMEEKKKLETLKESGFTEKIYL
ncbi:MAG: DNA primase [Lachnospiraceae bacterium]|nr:DNA primase [Lachnospiraceae bacterium]